MSEHDLDSRKARLLEAAGRLFAENGFEATTIRDICQQADANIAAVNYYFGDKRRLYVEAVVQAHRWKMDQGPLPTWSDDTPPQAKLTDFVTAFVRRVRTAVEGNWQKRLVMREMLEPSEACAELVQESIRPEFEILQSILRELLPGEVAKERLHLLAFSIVGQCLFYHFADPVIRNLLTNGEYASYDNDKLAEHILAFSLTAIEAERARQPQHRTGVER